MAELTTVPNMPWHGTGPHHRGAPAPRGKEMSSFTIHIYRTFNISEASGKVCLEFLKCGETIWRPELPILAGGAPQRSPD